MNYIVRVKYSKDDSQYIVPSLGMLLRLEWEFIEAITSNSLLDINKVISKNSWPLINDMSYFRIHKCELIYREDMQDYIYLISDEELAFKEKIRNNRLIEILYDAQ